MELRHALSGVNLSNVNYCCGNFDFIIKPQCSYVCNKILYLYYIFVRPNLNIWQNVYKFSFCFIFSNLWRIGCTLQSLPIGCFKILFYFSSPVLPRAFVLFVGFFGFVFIFDFMFYVLVKVASLLLMTLKFL